jgi:formylglycine-generating enzyme required for sulfatase activity
MVKKERPNPQKSPWYEGALLWGAFSAALGITLVVVAAMMHDLRWLLAVAWPFWVVTSWAATMSIGKPRIRRLVVGLFSTVALFGLGYLYYVLRPDRIDTINADGHSLRVNPVDGLVYVFIPPNSFTMGCSPGDGECTGNDESPHVERIDDGFWLGQTEVTQKAWADVKKTSPSLFRGAQLPVERVSWREAAKYCEAIGGRLPTEKEWEYAARAGSTGPLYGPLDEIAWVSFNSDRKTHPVGRKKKNLFLLFDMIGNVSEWTSDGQADSSGTEMKWVRGCAYTSPNPTIYRVSFRQGRWITAGPERHNIKWDWVGFRCVWTKP